VAETAAGKAIGKGSPELGRELLKYEFQNGEKLLRAGDRAEDIAARVGMARQETTQQLSAMRSQLDDAFAKLPQPDLGGAVARADEVLQPLRSSPVPAVRAQAARLDDQLAGLREAASGEPIAVKLPDGSSSTAAREPLSFGQLEQLRESVKLPAGASPEVSAAFEQVGRAISKPMEAAEAALGPAAKDYRAAQQRLARLEQAEAIAKAVPQEQGGMLSGLGMGTVMSALTGNVGGVAAGAVSGLANKLVAERGKSVLAVMADRASQATQRVDSAARVAALVDKPSRLAAPVAVNVARMFERYTKDLDKSDDEVADGLGELTAQLQYASPEMAAAVTERALADRAYLKSIAPQPTTNANQTLTPKATKASYSFDQKKQFVDSAVALEKPLSVFEDIARGDLPLSKIEALKERRPLLFQEMRSTVVRYTVERDEELPYPRRMLLGVAFGFPSDWSIANVTTIQESLAPPDKAQTDPTAAPSKVTDEPGAAIEPGGF
jgi:hypothetical protein